MERGGGRGRRHSRPKEKYVQRPRRQREHVCSGTLWGVEWGWGSPRAGTGAWREGSGLDQALEKDRSGQISGGVAKDRAQMGSE